MANARSREGEGHTCGGKSVRRTPLCHLCGKGEETKANEEAGGKEGGPREGSGKRVAQEEEAREGGKKTLISETSLRLKHANSTFLCPAPPHVMLS